MEYACEKAGFDLDKIEELRVKEEQRRMEMQKEMAQFSKTQPFQQGHPQQGQKGEEVWEVRRKEVK